MVVPRPMGQYVVVKPLDGDEMSHGGVLLPPEVSARATRGVIVAVGPGYRKMESVDTPEYVPLDLHGGDVIIWDKRNGVGIEVEGEELLVLNSQDVLVVLEEAQDRVHV